MSEQVVSGDGGSNEASANVNKQQNIKLQDNQELQKIDGQMKTNSLPPGETNNNNSTTCLESGDAKREKEPEMETTTTEKGEKGEKGERKKKKQSSNSQNSHNQHHRHRRHSNNNEQPGAGKFPKSALQSSSSSSSSFESSAAAAAAAASNESEPTGGQSGPGSAGEPELCGQPRGDATPATGATGGDGAGKTATQLAPSSQCLSSSSAGSPSLQQVVGDKSQVAAAAAAAEATCQVPTTTTNALTSGQVTSSAGEGSLQNCSSNIALLPIAADCDSITAKAPAENQKTDLQQVSTIPTTITSTSNVETNNNNSYHQAKQQETPNLKTTTPTTITTTATATRNNSNSYHAVDNHQLLQDDSCKRWSITSSGDQFCKRRKLSYFQSLLLRKWPCLAISICIMSSLLFGILLSALTVYLLHGAASDCSGFARAAAAAAGESNAPPHLLLGQQGNPHQLLRRPDFADPAGLVDQLASLTGSSSGNGNGEYSSSGQLRAAASLGATELSQSTPPARFQRLPSSLWPIHYDLFVQPYIAEPFNFTGKVTIKIKCTEATDNITLHTLDLELDEKTISLQLAPQSSAPGRLAAANNGHLRRDRRKPAANAPKVKGLGADKQLQYSIINLDSPLEAGQEYLLGIDFVGVLNDDLAGFYKIKYERQNSSETTWIAATQFQATDARRAFPCFDEPLYKATFSIQIKHWKNMTALSNMPIIDQQDSPDGLWVTDTFSKSQRMSTYLVAYAVTNFESRSEGNISVWTRPGFSHTAEYALKTAGKLLRYYEDFFGIGYPLPKMDMIALPDFNAGAMENWGLITYRETAMLYDENSSSISNKQRVAVVVAHELAHQWFGNLVTPKWWDDLWLNEGFASYVEYIGVDHVEPKWRMLDQFVVEEVQNVFKTDGLSSSHQISIPVNNPDEISEIFDHISYAKGASIIRMMNHFLTESVFKQGLRGYLSALRYGNAEQSDLWRHLTEAQRNNNNNNNNLSFSKQVAVDVERVMNSWTLQTGFPLVTLTRQYNGPNASAQLEQARYQAFKTSQTFNRSGELAANVSLTTPLSGSDQRWEIPITFTSKSEQNWQPKTRLWMHQADSKAIQLNSSQLAAGDDDWVLLNVNQVGYYRVNYDIRNWKLLIKQLNVDHKLISTTNRAQILDDIFELARSGAIDYRFAMEATKYLRGERDYLPWETVLMSFSYIDDMLQRTSIYGDWKDYVADLIAPYYARYRDTEWTIRGKQQVANQSQLAAVQSALPPADVDDVLEHYNQVNAIAWACQVDAHCIEKAKSIFDEWKRSGRNQINPALRYTIYCTAIENGNKDDWNFLWRIYEKEPNASERDRIMRALGCTKEIWLLSRYLEWTFSKTKPIRRQDGAFVFRVIAKNNYGRDIAFNFMRERWSVIKEFYGKTSFSLGNLIRAVSTSMNTQVELNQLMGFYETIKADAGTGKRSFQIAIEEVESNVLWRNRSYKIIEDWIQEARGYKAAASPIAMAGIQ